MVTTPNLEDEPWSGARHDSEYCILPDAHAADGLNTAGPNSIRNDIRAMGPGDPLYPSRRPISFELFGHHHRVIDDEDVFFEYEMAQIASRILKTDA